MCTSFLTAGMLLTLLEIVRNPTLLYGMSHIFPLLLSWLTSLHLYARGSHRDHDIAGARGRPLVREQ